MIRINQLKLPVDHTEEALWAKAAKTLKIPVKEIRSIQIIKQSVDARKKRGNPFYLQHRCGNYKRRVCDT